MSKAQAIVAAFAASMTMSAMTPAAAQTPDPPAPARFKNKGLCGTAADLHFCGTLVQPETAPDDLPIALEPLKFKAARGQTVQVTWHGTVYCEGYAKILNFNQGVFSVVAHLQLQEGKQSPIAYNGPGSASVGESTALKGDALGAGLNFRLYPVSLSRVFKVDKTRELTFFAVADAEFHRRQILNGRCNVNGGAMTAQVVIE